MDWEADPDREWRSAADDGPEELRALWEEAVERSRVLIEEYARHNGHADLLRESVDGRTGE